MITYTSPKGTMNKEDWIKVGKGALIALGGALLTYLADVIQLINIGSVWTPIAVSVGSILINMGRKWLSNT